MPVEHVVDAPGVPRHRRVGRRVEVPSEDLAFVTEETLAQLLVPEALNGGNLVDIYQQREEDFAATAMLEVKYNLANGSEVRETVYVDSLEPSGTPRICVSVDAVRAMHRAISVLTRKVDNLGLTLKSCREHYYKELIYLRHGRVPEHEAFWFTPSAYEDNVTKQMVRDKLNAKEVQLNQALFEQEKELQRLRNLVNSNEEATSTELGKLRKIVAEMPLDQLFLIMRKQNMNREAAFYQQMERMLIEKRMMEGGGEDLAGYYGMSNLGAGGYGGGVASAAAEAEIASLRERADAADERIRELEAQVQALEAQLEPYKGVRRPSLGPGADVLTAAISAAAAAVEGNENADPPIDFWGDLLMGMEDDDEEDEEAAKQRTGKRLSGMLANNLQAAIAASSGGQSGDGSRPTSVAEVVASLKERDQLRFQVVEMAAKAASWEMEAVGLRGRLGDVQREMVAVAAELSESRSLTTRLKKQIRAIERRLKQGGDVAGVTSGLQDLARLAKASAALTASAKRDSEAIVAAMSEPDFTGSLLGRTRSKLRARPGEEGSMGPLPEETLADSTGTESVQGGRSSRSPKGIFEGSSSRSGSVMRRGTSTSVPYSEQARRSRKDGRLSTSPGAGVRSPGAWPSTPTWEEEEAERVGSPRAGRPSLHGAARRGSAVRPSELRLDGTGLQDGATPPLVGIGGAATPTPTRLPGFGARRRQDAPSPDDQRALMVVGGRSLQRRATSGTPDAGDAREGEGGLADSDSDKDKEDNQEGRDDREGEGEAPFSPTVSEGAGSSKGGAHRGGKARRLGSSVSFRDRDDVILDEDGGSEFGGEGGGGASGSRGSRLSGRGSFDDGGYWGEGPEEERADGGSYGCDSRSPSGRRRQSFSKGRGPPSPGSGRGHRAGAWKSGERAWELLAAADGAFCDLLLLADDEERIPASSLLLGAASRPLERVLRELGAARPAAARRLGSGAGSGAGGAARGSDGSSPGSGDAAANGPAVGAATPRKSGAAGAAAQHGPGGGGGGAVAAGLRPLELRLPGTSAAAARALVACSCGLARPFDGCSPADARAVELLLERGLPGEDRRGGSAGGSKRRSTAKWGTDGRRSFGGSRDRLRRTKSEGAEDRRRASLAPGGGEGAEEEGEGGPPGARRRRSEETYVGQDLEEEDGGGGGARRWAGRRSPPGELDEEGRRRSEEDQGEEDGHRRRRREGEEEYDEDEDDSSMDSSGSGEGRPRRWEEHVALRGREGEDDSSQSSGSEEPNEGNAGGQQEGDGQQGRGSVVGKGAGDDDGQGASDGDELGPLPAAGSPVQGDAAEGGGAAAAVPGDPSGDPSAETPVSWLEWSASRAASAMADPSSNDPTSRAASALDAGLTPGAWLGALGDSRPTTAGSPAQGPGSPTDGHALLRRLSSGLGAAKVPLSPVASPEQSRPASPGHNGEEAFALRSASPRLRLALKESSTQTKVGLNDLAASPPTWCIREPPPGSGREDVAHAAWARHDLLVWCANYMESVHPDILHRPVLNDALLRRVVEWEAAAEQLPGTIHLALARAAAAAAAARAAGNATGRFDPRIKTVAAAMGGSVLDSRKGVSTAGSLNRRPSVHHASLSDVNGMLSSTRMKSIKGAPTKGGGDSTLPPVYGAAAPAPAGPGPILALPPVAPGEAPALLPAAPAPKPPPRLTGPAAHFPKRLSQLLGLANAPAGKEELSQASTGSGGPHGQQRMSQLMPSQSRTLSEESEQSTSGSEGEAPSMTSVPSQKPPSLRLIDATAAIPALIRATSAGCQGLDPLLTPARMSAGRKTNPMLAPRPSTSMPPPEPPELAEPPPVPEPGSPTAAASSVPSSGPPSFGGVEEGSRPGSRPASRGSVVPPAFILPAGRRPLAAMGGWRASVAQGGVSSRNSTTIIQGGLPPRRRVPPPRASVPAPVAVPPPTTPSPVGTSRGPSSRAPSANSREGLRRDLSSLMGDSLEGSDGDLSPAS